MHTRLIAVGNRQPAWVDEAFRIYSGRLPPQWKFRLDIISTARRNRTGDMAQAVESEGESILGKLSDREQVILLDEKGTQLTSRALGERLSRWQSDGRDLAFVIGGPDGVSGACRERADFTWSLSDLTLPHGLARVLFVEQIYRAWSLMSGHPYHRE